MRYFFFIFYFGDGSSEGRIGILLLTFAKLEGYVEIHTNADLGQRGNETNTPRGARYLCRYK